MYVSGKDGTMLHYAVLQSVVMPAIHDDFADKCIVNNNSSVYIFFFYFVNSRETLKQGCFNANYKQHNLKFCRTLKMLIIFTKLRSSLPTAKCSKFLNITFTENLFPLRKRIASFQNAQWFKRFREYIVNLQMCFFQLRFFYHMTGKDISKLEVNQIELCSNYKKTLHWIRVGEQGRDWNFAEVSNKSTHR